MSIDYEKYLQELGEINTEQKSVIKKYLEEQCQKDDALKSVYSPEKIDDCYDFIVNCARKAGKTGTSCIEDSIVFKMARDFYLEILPNQADESVKKVEKKQNEKKSKTVAETAVQAEMIEQENENTEKVRENHSEEKPKIDNLDTFEVFGEEDYVTAETAKKKNIVSENENVTENLSTKYDKDGCGLLFEF